MYEWIILRWTKEHFSRDSWSQPQEVKTGGVSNLIVWFLLTPNSHWEWAQHISPCSRFDSSQSAHWSAQWSKALSSPKFNGKFKRHSLMPLRFSMEISVNSTSVIHVLVDKTTEQIGDTRLLAIQRWRVPCRSETLIKGLQLHESFLSVTRLLLGVFLKLTVFKILDHRAII